MIHGSLQHQREGPIAQSRKAAREGLRFGEDIGPYRQTNCRSVFMVRYLFQTGWKPASEEIPRGAFFEIGDMCDSGQ